MNKVLKDFILKYQNIFTIIGLGIIFYFIFMHNIWTYALMDVDESRYVLMAKDMFHTKDYMTLYLNGEYFFEKPPLFFWIECLSFGLFGGVSEAAARFPVALLGILCCYTTYFICKKVYSRNYGIVSSLMLATSLEFLILARYAILDIVVSSFIWFSLTAGMMVFFCKEEHKKYYWWMFYIFSGLAVMAKGIPGLVIPFGSMFFISLTAKKFKEIFKPQYILPGIFLFLLIVLPWHIIMLQKYDPLFFNEYIIKHHIQRFLGGDSLGREQPFYFYILTVLWGFFPWIVSTIAVLGRKIIKKDFNIKELTNIRKFLLYNGIIAGFIMLFFSSSDTKLITYILPIYPSLACLGGYVWTNYLERGEYKRFIDKTVYIIGILFILVSVLAWFSNLYLPEQIVKDLSSIKVFSVVTVLLCGIVSIFFVKKEKYVALFLTYVVFIATVSGFGTEKFYEIDYLYGQDDLLKFASYAKEHDKAITCYQFQQKYSLIYYGEEKVEFGNSYDIPELKKALYEKNNLVIIPKKAVTTNVKQLNYKTLDTGRKYILIEKN